jgi:hypothetical protein
MEKVETLYHLNLTKEHKQLARFIINRFGTGQHPVADSQTIDGFAISYLKELINGQEFQKEKSNLSALGIETLNEIETIFNTYQS